MKGPLLSDLDGTIADTAPVLIEAFNVVCAAMDLELPSDHDFTRFFGPPLHWCLEELGVPEDRMADAISVFETVHVERMDLVTPMPGADVVIRELSADGVHIGVATIKPQYAAELVLKTIDLSECITVVHGRTDDMDPRTKTDLLRAARDQLRGDSPLYVGDHENDARAARELGIPFLWYPQHRWDEVRAAILS